MRLFRAPVRVAALIRKEMRELLRRPGAVLSLVIGPILVMALFGLGFTGERKPIEMEVVVPKDSGLPMDAASYQKIAGNAAHVREVVSDPAVARASLDRGDCRMIVIIPADAQATIQKGQQAVLQVETNEIDPVDHGAIMVVAEQLVREINAEIVLEAARQGYARLGAAGVQTPNVPPEVVAHPFRGEVSDRAPVKPELLIFFAPAVLALVLQHLSLTLTALSLVRERMSGAMDLFRVAPIGTLELLLGKYVTYAILSLLVAAVVVVATTVGLGIPFRGQPADLAVAVTLLTFASLGLGLLISLVSDSERQAVQLSMLVLLFSVFFSGFVLSVHEFRMPVQLVSYLLPVTYGITAFQDLMLRGALQETGTLAALGVMGCVLFALSALRLGRVLQPVH